MTNSLSKKGRKEYKSRNGEQGSFFKKKEED